MFMDWIKCSFYKIWNLMARKRLLYDRYLILRFLVLTFFLGLLKCLLSNLNSLTHEKVEHLKNVEVGVWSLSPWKRVTLEWQFASHTCQITIELPTIIILWIFYSIIRFNPCHRANNSTWLLIIILNSKTNYDSICSSKQGITPLMPSHIYLIKVVEPIKIFTLNLIFF